jgi:hypothetical protein
MHLFWDCFYQLPKSTQILAKKNFKLLKNDLNHPSLSFKKVGKFWSPRVSINYRYLAFKDGEDYIWVWIGSHEEYERLLK